MKKFVPWTARPIEGTARVEVLDANGGLVCISDAEHAAEIITTVNAVETIHGILDEEGAEWDSETMSAVAEVVTDLGYTIRDPNDAEGDDGE